MVNDEDDLDGEPTETFSFKMSKALRARLGGIAGAKRITVGQEVLRRVLLSFAEASTEDVKAEALETRVAALEARIAKVEKHFQKD